MTWILVTHIVQIKGAKVKISCIDKYCGPKLFITKIIQVFKIIGLLCDRNKNVIRKFQ
jgi:hypothetical protein